MSAGTLKLGAAFVNGLLNSLCAILTLFFCDCAEKNRNGVEESGMERPSANNSISGGPAADSYLTCIFRLTPSSFRRMNSTAII